MFFPSQKKNELGWDHCNNELIEYMVQNNLVPIHIGIGTWTNTNYNNVNVDKCVRLHLNSALSKGTEYGTGRWPQFS